MPKGNTKFTAADPAMAGRSVKALLRDSKNNLSQRVKTRLNNTREQRTKCAARQSNVTIFHGSRARSRAYVNRQLASTTIRLPNGGSLKDESISARGAPRAGETPSPSTSRNRIQEPRSNIEQFPTGHPAEAFARLET